MDLTDAAIIRAWRTGRLAVSSSPGRSVPVGIHEPPRPTVLNDRVIDRFEVAEPGRDFELYSQVRL